MENEKAKEIALTFGVDLNKTEYMAFQKTVAQFTSGKRFFRFVSVGLAVFEVLMVVNILKNDVALLKDPEVLSLLVFFALMLVGWLVFPRIAEHRRAAKGYEDAVAGGQVFEGMVTVNADGITKVTESGTLTLSFNTDLLFIEKQDMLIFINRFGQGIVLPARCLTAADAKAVRDIAANGINPRFYIRKSGIQPKATARMVFKDGQSATKTVYTVDVAYTEDERKGMIKTVIRRDIFRTAPTISVCIFLLSVSIGLSNGFTAAAISFWVAFLLFAGVKALFWIPRYKGASLAEDASLTVTFTEKAVVAEKRGPVALGKVILQWKDIRHAVESDEAVELYNNRQYLYIPKRCVGDMDFLRSIVNEKLNRDAQERNE